jgi:PEP-CTERM motif
MRTRFALTLGLGMVLLASDVRADSFTVQPDGSVLFDTTLATTGVFTCRHSQCSGTGTNTVTFVNASGRATITFTGVSTAIQVSNRATPVTLGVFEATATPGFVFPERRNIYNPVFHFRLIATHGDPIDASTRKGWNFLPGGRSRIPASGTRDFNFSLPPDFDPRFGYTAINYHVRRGFGLPSNGTQNLVADQGVVPEPASLLLLGSGLVGAAMARRRRRKKS